FVTASGILLYFFSRVFVELARLEQELLVMRQRHAKGQRLEAMATLAAGAAHELSSPLSTIAVIAKELERDASTPGVPSTMLEDTRLIREEVKRCRRILDRMSADAGESAGEALVPTTLTALFEEIVAELPARDRVRVTVADGVAQQRFSLPHIALSQALRGIVQNALDASAADQQVDLVAEAAMLADADGLRILVKDSGAGMEADTLERVGTPFFTTKEVGAGTGLGIFLARTVVERLGGALWIDSSPGRGTLVSIEIPALGAPSGETPYT
ncbi:MAG TPA: HAMP domain-containing sensor histidine kinase, partial [Planctomycetota bacterium]|nr:HAMP domain-containing sensor histidine kinase [Planctomycetota bacterium]